MTMSTYYDYIVIKCHESGVIGNSKCSADLFCRSAAFRFKSSCNDRAKFATHLRAMLCAGSSERNGRARAGTKNRRPQEQVRAWSTRTVWRQASDRKQIR